MKIEDFLTVRQFATEAGVQTKVIHLQKEKLGAVKIGHIYLLPKSSLNKVIKRKQGRPRKLHN